MNATGICNLALGYLGQNPISTLGVDTSTAGKLCSAFYPGAKRALLESRNWTFSKKVWAVTPAAAPTHPVWVGAYAVPAECMRVQRVDDGSGDYRLGWERIGAQILTDDTPATIYVEGVYCPAADGDEAGYPQAFCFALAAHLATELCIPLTENATLWTALLKVSELKVREASGSDGSQGRSEFIRSDSLARRR